MDLPFFGSALWSPGSAAFKRVSEKKENVGCFKEGF